MCASSCNERVVVCLITCEDCCLHALAQSKASTQRHIARAEPLARACACTGCCFDALWRDTWARSHVTVAITTCTCPNNLRPLPPRGAPIRFVGPFIHATPLDLSHQQRVLAGYWRPVLRGIGGVLVGIGGYWRSLGIKPAHST